MRVVLDANVFVSSILSGAGTPARILDAWRDERFQLLISDAILDEMGRVLRYPKIAQRHGWTEAEIDRFLRHRLREWRYLVADLERACHCCHFLPTSFGCLSSCVMTRSSSRPSSSTETASVTM